MGGTIWVTRFPPGIYPRKARTTRRKNVQMLHSLRAGHHGSERTLLGELLFLMCTHAVGDVLVTRPDGSDAAHVLHALPVAAEFLASPDPAGALWRPCAEEDNAAVADPPTLQRRLQWFGARAAGGLWRSAARYARTQLLPGSKAPPPKRAGLGLLQKLDRASRAARAVLVRWRTDLRRDGTPLMVWGRVARFWEQTHEEMTSVFVEAMRACDTN